ncbi:hypothetical protein vBSlqSZDD2_69 [Serratia phage vB_SlqS_ZDD2]|nr:hypothetical protein vBSlqSZDD2_69 [Serratia phage vB_SlqS_ZDD2]
MGWGFKTWDVNGNDNNTGIVKMLVLTPFWVEQDQPNGSWWMEVPQGFVLRYFVVPQLGLPQKRRRFEVNGNNITSREEWGYFYDPNVQPCYAGWVIPYLERQA